MVRVIYIIPKLKVGGAEALFSETKEGTYTNFILYKYCLDLSSNSPVVIFKQFFIFLNFIKQNNISIIISSLWKAHFFSLIGSYLLRSKTVPFIHSSAYFSLFDKFVSRLILSKSDKCLVDSMVTEQFIQSQFRDIQIVRVSTFLGLSITNQDKKIYFENPQQLRFVFLGRISKVKRIDKSVHFLNQLRKLLPSNIDILFDLYGPIEVSQKVIDDLKESAKFTIKFKRSLERDDLYKTLSCYDFYLQMSDVEGMAMSVIEAMSVGLIPIVTNVGEIRKYCKHHFNSFSYETTVEMKVACQDVFQAYSNAEYLNNISNNSMNTTKQYKDFRKDFIHKIDQIIS